jgi:hypothetical protein
MVTLKLGSPGLKRQPNKSIGACAGRRRFASVICLRQSAVSLPTWRKRGCMQRHFCSKASNFFGLICFWIKVARLFFFEKRLIF